MLKTFSEGINFEKLTHDDLIDLIYYCQKELYQHRGTITQCVNVFYSGTEEIKYITSERQRI